MFICLLAAVAVYSATFFFAPFPLRRSFLHVLWKLLSSREVPFSNRLGLLGHTAVEVLVSPVFLLLHLIDEVFYADFRKVQIKAPVFILGQPRSGTTFLHRTLSINGELFSLKHLEWRYPFVCLWKLIDLVGIRSLIESINYWPKGHIGDRANKMHHHCLGSYEEHGIFLEERYYQHYFVFRRFPYPDLLQKVSSFNTLSVKDRACVLGGLKATVQKAMYFHGSEKIWLTKENESVELYELMADIFPDARYLLIARNSEDFIQSYIDLSVTSTMAKTGLDPRAIKGWSEANLAFRADECERMIAFSNKIAQTNICVLLPYEQLVQDIPASIAYVCDGLGIAQSEADIEALCELQRQQAVRVRGYARAAEPSAGFEFFDDFVASCETHYAQYFKATERTSDDRQMGSAH